MHSMLQFYGGAQEVAQGMDEQKRLVNRHQVSSCTDLSQIHTP